MSGSKTLVTLMRRLVRTHGLAAMLDAIADVLDAAGNPSLRMMGSRCAAWPDGSG